MNDNYKKCKLALDFVEQNFISKDYFRVTLIPNTRINQMNLIGRQVAKEISNELYCILNGSLNMQEPNDPVDHCIIELIFLLPEFKKTTSIKDKDALLIRTKIYTRLLGYLKKC